MIRLYIKQAYAKRKTLTKTVKEEIKKLRDKGYTYKMISEKFNVSHYTIYATLFPDKYNSIKYAANNTNKQRYRKDKAYREKIKKRANSFYYRKKSLRDEGKLTKTQGE